ncbi:MAG: zf-HC2 domain-containing protein [Planctomycetes bacterium]|nr:zf-HC2 domain-containing protein [Planctomycetota bacterium]
MSCEEFETKLADFVTDRLPDAERDTVAEHVRGCARCREFGERIRTLYRLEESIPEPAKGAGAAIAVPASFDDGDRARGASSGDAQDAMTQDAPPSRWMRALSRIAALFLLAFFAYYLFHLTYTRYRLQIPRDPESAVAWEPLPLRPMGLALPALPVAYAEGAFVESRKEAELFASYVGKPVLEQYVHPYCTRCIAVKDALETVAERDELRAFVWHRESYASMPEEWAAKWPQKEMVPFSLPSIRIRSAKCETEPIWQVSGPDEIAALIEKWRERCPEDAEPAGTPLDRATFERSLRAMNSLPELLAAVRIAEAVRALDELVALEDDHRTEFSVQARKLRDEIFVQLECELTRIAALASGGERDRCQGRDLAQRLRAAVRGLPIEERFASYCE